MRPGIAVMIRNGLSDAGGHVPAVGIGVRDMIREVFGPLNQYGLGVLNRRHRADNLSNKLGVGRLRRFCSLAHRLCSLRRRRESVGDRPRLDCRQPIRIPGQLGGVVYKIGLIVFMDVADFGKAVPRFRERLISRNKNAVRRRLGKQDNFRSRRQHFPTVQGEGRSSVVIKTWQSAVFDMAFPTGALPPRPV